MQAHKEYKYHLLRTYILIVLLNIATVFNCFLRASFGYLPLIFASLWNFVLMIISLVSGSLLVKKKHYDKTIDIGDIDRRLGPISVAN